MSEKINVKEFVDGYTKSKNKALYLKKLEIVDYVSYGQKAFLADKIIKSSSYDENGYVRINSPSRYLIFVYTILKTYTNLDLESESMLEDFDLLNKHGIVDEIFALVPEKEINEFNKVLSMTYDDFITNHYEIHGFIQEVVKKISDTVDGTSPELLNELRNYLSRSGDGE